MATFSAEFMAAIHRMQPFLVVMVFLALGFMSAGFLLRDRRAHLLRIIGWIGFALYWPFQAPEYFYGSEPDPVNGMFALFGPIFLIYVAMHEWNSYQWDEDPEALRWFTGAVAVTSLTYFIIAEIPGVATWLMRETAQQSAWLYNTLFFGGAERAVVDSTNNICLPPGAATAIPCGAGQSYAVTVILACTAIQSIMIFVGAIACLQAPSRAKWIGYAITVPTIYSLNLFRNAGIVYGTYDLHWSFPGFWILPATTPFEWMHSYIGKIGSLIAMIIIALGLFATLPKLHSNILDLFDLPKRRARGFFDRPPPPPPSKVDPAPAPAEV